MQLWMTTVAAARSAARTAQEIEAAGWDGMLVVDSQNLSGDPYVALAWQRQERPGSVWAPASPTR